MDRTQIMKALRRCELFYTLTEEQISAISELCEIESYEVGATIFSQGELSDRLYLILEGQVALHRLVNMGNRQATISIGLLGKGRIMGWSALLGVPSSRTATATCQKPTQVIFFEGERLRSLIEKQTDTGFKVMERLAHVLGDRLRSAYTAMDTHL